MRDLNSKMVRGAFWMGLSRICVRGVALVSTIILARLLVPADFGLIAMATSIVAFLELLTAFSFDIPLIQKQDATRRHFDTAWTLNVAFCTGLTLVLLALAEPAASFYREERLIDVIYVLAAGFFIKGFENIGVVHFRKELDFKRDFLLLLSKKLIGFAVTIPLAFYFRSYWALVAGIVIGNTIGVALTYLLHPFRPRPSLSAAREMLSFSTWLVFNNAISFLRTRSPDFIIGRMSGSSALGLFTVAYEIATLPTTELVAPINRVVFPGYSKLAKDLALLRASYLDVLAVVALVALPAGFGLSAIATPLVDSVLGASWVEAAPLVGILAIFGAINSLLTNNGSIYNALGKPYMITMLGSAYTLVLVLSAIALGSRFGPAGVAAAYTGTVILFAPVSLYMIGRELGIGVVSFAQVLWRPATCTLFMYAGLAYLDDYLLTNLSSVAALAVLITAGTALYFTTSLFLWAVTGRPQTVEVRLVCLLIEKVRPRQPQGSPR